MPCFTLRAHCVNANAAALLLSGATALSGGELAPWPRGPVSELAAGLSPRQPRQPPVMTCEPMSGHVRPCQAMSGYFVFDLRLLGLLATAHVHDD